jgi:D-tyrosyl-tRNA(Tyr) deacylase
VRSVVQRVTRASVLVDGAEVGRIEAGLLVLVGVEEGDGPADIEYTASKIRDLRIFKDDAGKMNRSVVESGGAVLVVSQFTLLADVRRGRRPGFDAAAPPVVARERYEELVSSLRAGGLTVATGQFQADMQVDSVNDGPVTILLDSRRLF